MQGEDVGYNGVNLSAHTPEAASAKFLRLKNVNVARGEAVVLHDINLNIAVGEHVALLGPNGCGKSTLIKTIACECYPIVVPGMEVSIYGRERWDLTALRRHLGVVQSGLPGEQTLKTTGLNAVIAGFFSASTLWPNLKVMDEMSRRSWEALERLAIGHLATKLVGEMSSGEKRRILIARALVHRPRTLLLDEPSNDLDLAAQRELRESLRRLAREGTGILMVTHHLADILPEMDRVLLMKQGRIVADGPKNSTLTAAALETLFGVPVEMVEREGFLYSW
jgi:iron complex transport system ATP-binding protein